jgi:poly(A) polymerase
MPIITPNYPSMCATHNVSASTLAILSEQIQNGSYFISAPSPVLTPAEFRIHNPGADTVNKVIAGTAPWSELFSKHDFFHRYRNYIQVIALTQDPQQQIKW